MKQIREKLEEIEERSLSEKACFSSRTQGRRRPEELHAIRTEFQRDRDRITHCKAFRRLKHKTQVFLAPYGDHYRTRLTHTLEVSQIARTIAKALCLNVDLTEAIALGHDLGHTPFGHAGEQTLAGLLPGGFTHSLQSLRVVEQLEYEGKGLNLTHEVRDGIARHSKGKGKILSGNKKEMPFTLEGQIVRVSDVIAYVNHDIDDAVRAGVIQVDEIPPDLVVVLGRYHSQRIDSMVVDVVESSLETGLDSIAMSGKIEAVVNRLRDFLYERVYFSETARAEFYKTEKIMGDLYSYFLSHPEGHVKPYPEQDSLEVRTGDCIAGMTDRYALGRYKEFVFPKSWPIL
ncbi:MAG: deoxyguanosinetriphosphate triphosphohydrolase [Acidobacteria bacterium]|nr:deoxyguanosinetriphosphate triphosphohydrolase [Acidobacteriota bacterium]MBU1474760.1 deoxyguanosinetriphosphate triphosphohydrolase [Acidobacteriota bacterium]